MSTNLPLTLSTCTFSYIDCDGNPATATITDGQGLYLCMKSYPVGNGCTVTYYDLGLCANSLCSPATTTTTACGCWEVQVDDSTPTPTPTQGITPTPTSSLPPTPTPSPSGGGGPTPGQRPTYDHIFIIWMENKAYLSIVGSGSAPYINNTLIAGGTLFTNFWAYGQPSQPNYICGFAGQTCGITSNSDMVGSTPSYTQPNLYTQLLSAGKTFVSYMEGLPSAGSMTFQTGRYYGKHDPARNFANVPQATVRRPWTDIPTNLNTCANVVYLIPDIVNDMHDGGVSAGDSFLQNDPACQRIINYCANPANNSLFVLYFDEGNISTADNRIACTFYGANVKVGFQENTKYGLNNTDAPYPHPTDNGHFCLSKTILDMYGAPNMGNTASATLMVNWWI